MDQITQELKDNVFDLARRKGCTLDGQPAAICGKLNQFATVYQRYGIVEVEYSWQAAARIMAAGGAFLS